MKTRIHILHTGRVRVSPYLPFEGEGSNLIKASGLFASESDRLWLPVSAYLIEHPKGLLLLDCGWSREMSPDGVYDASAQKRHLSPLLYHVNQGEVGPGQTACEQLAAMGIAPSDIDYVLLSHLDCDHASALREFAAARRILIARKELSMARKKHPVIRTRFQKSWWDGVPYEVFEFAHTGAGPVGKSLDLFGDGSIELVNIPGHSDGLFATIVRGQNGRFVNLVSDGGYGKRSWQNMVLPGIALDKEKQRASLAWIKETDADPNCIATIANHDTEIEPHAICL